MAMTQGYEYGFVNDCWNCGFQGLAPIELYRCPNCGKSMRRARPIGLKLSRGILMREGKESKHRPIQRKHHKDVEEIVYKTYDEKQHLYEELAAAIERRVPMLRRR